MAGKLWLPFDFLKTYPPFDNPESRKELVIRLNGIRGFSFNQDKLDTWTATQLDGLLEDDNFLKFCEIIFISLLICSALMMVEGVTYAQTIASEPSNNSKIESSAEEKEQKKSKETSEEAEEKSSKISAKKLLKMI